MIAKIHTVEWTPAILPHPIIKIAMHTNWSGLVDEDLAGGPQVPRRRRAARRHRRLARRPPHRAVFADRGVRRRVPHASADSGRVHVPSRSRRAPGARDARAARGRRPANATPCSSGSRWPISSTRSASPIPGAVTLHNYPQHLQNLTLDNGEHFDLAAVDILRDRERGVPRYNQFRAARAQAAR